MIRCLLWNWLEKYEFLSRKGEPNNFLGSRTCVCIYILASRSSQLIVLHFGETLSFCYPRIGNQISFSVLKMFCLVPKISKMKDSSPVFHINLILILAKFHIHISKTMHRKLFDLFVMDVKLCLDSNSNNKKTIKVGSPCFFVILVCCSRSERAMHQGGPGEGSGSSSEQQRPGNAAEHWQGHRAHLLRQQWAALTAQCQSDLIWSSPI